MRLSYQEGALEVGSRGCGRGRDVCGRGSFAKERRAGGGISPRLIRPFRRPSRLNINITTETSVHSPEALAGRFNTKPQGAWFSVKTVVYT